MINYICLWCQKTYPSRGDRFSKFCSRACRGKHENTTITFTCLFCNKRFRDRNASFRKYCSKKCLGQVNKLHLKPYYSRLVHSEKVWNWKGEKVSYRSLHSWVSRWKGKPKQCEHCGLQDTKKRFHWANISKKYLRDLNDWIRLCPKCHKKFDS